MLLLLTYLILLLFSFGNTQWESTQECPSSINCVDLTEDCPSDLIGFHLYNDVYKDGYQLYLENITSMQEAQFTKNPIKLIIHGYSGNRNEYHIKKLRDAYFQLETKPDMIYVEWGVIAKHCCYITALTNVPLVGKCTSKFVKLLLKTRSDLSIDMIHPIGFNLGAHIAASAAVTLNDSSLIFDRITGLEPVLPYLYLINPIYIVSSASANFVDAYHTNVFVYGVPTSLADVDAYGNYGFTQPGCTGADANECSHNRVVDLYAESITAGKDGFYATKYINPYLKILIGEYCDRVRPLPVLFLDSCYYFETNSQPPYVKSIT